MSAPCKNTVRDESDVTAFESSECQSIPSRRRRGLTVCWSRMKPPHRSALFRSRERDEADTAWHHLSCAINASAPLSIPASAAVSGPTVALTLVGDGYCLVTNALSRREVVASKIL